MMPFCTGTDVNAIRFPNAYSLRFTIAVLDESVNVGKIVEFYAKFQTETQLLHSILAP